MRQGFDTSLQKDQDLFQKLQHSCLESTKKNLALVNEQVVCRESLWKQHFQIFP